MGEILSKYVGHKVAALFPGPKGLGSVKGNSFDSTSRPEATIQPKAKD